MTFHTRFDAETAPATVEFATGMKEAKCYSRLSPLEVELSLMDCAIPMTRIAEVDDLEEDSAFAGQNLFGMDDEEGASEEANFLRSARRSRLAQGRLVALRRRQVRSQLRRPAPYPMPGGQPSDELRNMRDFIYTPDPEALAAEEQPSVPLRVATHAISLSLVATALPVGAAVMTYNLLKGEDIRTTARLTTLTGLALAIIAGNPGLASIVGV